MANWRNSWERAKHYRDHIIILGLCFVIGGLAHNARSNLVAVGAMLLLIGFSAWRFGVWAWIPALIASALVTEGIASDKRAGIILFCVLLAVVVGWLFKKRKRGVRILGEKKPTPPFPGKAEDKKKIPYEKEVPCKFCGRFISKAELECPFCRKKQYDLSEINTLLEKKGRIQEALDNLELRFMDGDVDEEIYLSLKKKWNNRLADIEEKIISSQLGHKPSI